MDVPFYTAEYDFRLAPAEPRRSAAARRRPPSALRKGEDHGPTPDRHLGAAAGGHRLRPAGLRARDRVSRPPTDRGRRVPVLSGPHARRPAGRRGLGDRAVAHRDPQRHASRCALSLPLDHEPRRARDHDRRGAARVVLQPRRQARLPPLRRRLRRDRRRRRGGAGAHRPSARAARHRGREHRGRRGLRPSPTMSPRAAAWAARRRSISSSAACA